MFYLGVMFGMVGMYGIMEFFKRNKIVSKESIKSTEVKLKDEGNE